MNLGVQSPLDGILLVFAFFLSKNRSYALEMSLKGARFLTRISCTSSGATLQKADGEELWKSFQRGVPAFATRILSKGCEPAPGAKENMQ